MDFKFVLKHFSLFRINIIFSKSILKFMQKFEIGKNNIINNQYLTLLIRANNIKFFYSIIL
jgi:hypothetical protein